jgi:HAD superfamily hydrolase (TIGR01484 family)
MTESMQNRSEEFAPTKHNLEMLYKLRTPVPELKAHLRKVRHGIQKMQFFCKDMEMRRELLESLPVRFPDLAVSSSIVNNIEINSREAVKGNAILGLAGYLGLDPAETMAFGDDLNDISMLKAAGVGVAMANAPDIVKTAADVVTKSCDEDGVAYVLRQYI